MTAPSSPDYSLGNYLPEQFDLPEDPKELSSKFKEHFETFARQINRKDTGQYETEEVQINQTWAAATPQSKRYVYRKIFIFGAIAAGANLNIVHGITGITQFTRMYGNCITAIPDDRPIPFISIVAANQNIQVLRNGINLIISNGAAAPNIVSGSLVVEFLKQ